MYRFYAALTENIAVRLRLLFTAFRKIPLTEYQKFYNFTLFSPMFFPKTFHRIA